MSSTYNMPRHPLSPHRLCMRGTVRRLMHYVTAPHQRDGNQGDRTDKRSLPGAGIESGSSADHAAACQPRYTAFYLFYPHTPHPPAFDLSPSCHHPCPCRFERSSSLISTVSKYLTARKQAGHQIIRVPLKHMTFHWLPNIGFVIELSRYV